MLKPPPDSDKIPSVGSVSRAHSEAVIQAAVRVAKEIHAKALLVYADAIADLTKLSPLRDTKTRVILVTRNGSELCEVSDCCDQILSVPGFNLTRMGQIKMATLMAFSQQLLKPDDSFVFLTGPTDSHIDTMMVMSVGKEFELFQAIDHPELTERIRRVVFERVLTLALELANEGREGKPVGAIFVVGDTRNVLKLCQQNIINPFKGYTERERNIVDENMRETIKEFCTIDGAFILKGNGVIVSAGTYLRSAVVPDALPQGLGARHAASAAITSVTKSLAITLSESTGSVRVWRKGQLITEIEKAPKAPTRSGSD